jgi:hypothetical protein
LKAQATYTVQKWNEENWRVISPEVKLTKASVEYALKGSLEGTAAVEYLMFYKFFDSKDPHRSSAQYVGLMELDGKLDGKSGSFAVEDKGRFESGEAVSKLRVLEGSGKGELKGIKGTGKYLAGPQGGTFELDYEL